jgi:hypothetical protein
MLSLDAAYLNDAYNQWELKEADLYKMQYGKEQVQFTRCHTEKFELSVYEEPIPKAAQLELYREDDKVVGIKAKNVMDEDVYIEFYILNENVEEWMMGEILPAGGSAIILFNDINLSGISSGAYELKARVYDWDYEFYSDWINTGYALVIEDTTYTGKNVQVTKAYDEEYDSYLYNIDVAQFGPFENLAEAFCLEEDGQEDSERIYKTISGKYWQFGSEASDELTGIKHCVMDADDQKITCYTSVIPKEKLVISEIAWKDAPGNVTAEFSDVYTDWYTEYVQYVYDMGMMRGIKGTDRFEPNANITKAQVAQVLYNLAYQPSVKDRTVFKELKDVYEGEWYADAVAWAYNEGIVTGDLNTKKFNPNANVTREQLALMFSRYAEMEGRDTGYQSDLKDLQNAENVSDWALDGVKWAVAVGLISGIEKDGVKDLAPQGNATRAQVAAILMRFTQGL